MRLAAAVSAKLLRTPQADAKANSAAGGAAFTALAAAVTEVAMIAMDERLSIGVTDDVPARRQAAESDGLSPSAFPMLIQSRDGADRFLSTCCV